MKAWMSTLVAVVLVLSGSAMLLAADEPVSLKAQEAAVAVQAKWGLIKMAIDDLADERMARNNDSLQAYETVLVRVKEFVPQALSRYVLAKDAKRLDPVVVQKIEAAAQTLARIDYGVNAKNDPAKATDLVIARARQIGQDLEKLFAELPQPRLRLSYEQARQILDDEVYAVFDFLHVHYRLVDPPIAADGPTASRLGLLHSLAFATASRMFEYLVSNRMIVTTRTTPIIREINELFSLTVRVTQKFAENTSATWPWKEFQAKLADRYLEILEKLGNLRLEVLAL
ncbi:MAG: hypothetical protein OZSIB_2855 [Candidatus Ozemobacter sibiricus]|uniref:Nitric oxide-responding transcriptional regulator Dnr (Crp/Fnr family) n=1 Tax=Candidatus Ozemobacter sibiricus TaxID=2268124 RepID=A0A367ZIW3_9BACT|nr:MAG: hypothetical protein OZSIB_2855 [Candidatus Ozemobacter sibiricus]